MLFNFFSKKEEQIEESDDTLAAITYLIKRNDNRTLIDIELKEYNYESIEALSSLLDVLSSDTSYVETINMIKNALINDGEEELLLKLFTNIGQQAKNKVINSQQENIKDEPCIKPSDMLK
jgi:hypothetical protein